MGGLLIVSRILKDWIPAYLNYTAGTEAPRIMHFFCAVSCIAAVLRRRVWIDMKRFKWFPSFYIIFCAPPGIVSKTTTMDMGMSLVKQVPGIKFGPDVITWQALVTDFAAAREEFEWDGGWWPMSPITLASGELGNLINPQDREMVNVYITLWDGRDSLEKKTKMSGNDVVSAPWINMIACTTPDWIADNMPRTMIGGGFTSRCIFVYAEKKETFVAYPDEHVRADHDTLAQALTADLEYMATRLVGPATLDEGARKWGREWYEKLWSEANKRLDDDLLNGYLARKQTHMHKLALVLSVSEGDSLVITADHLKLADRLLASIEHDIQKVFSRIGKSEEALQAERFIGYVRKMHKVSYMQAYQYIHSYFPDFRDFEGVVRGAIASGQIMMKFETNSTDPTSAMLLYTGGKPAVDGGDAEPMPI